MSRLFELIRRLVRKYPKQSAIIFAFLVLISFISQPRPHPQTQEVDYDGVDEPFDGKQCKVYYAGVLLGANVFRFQYGSSDIYLMFTDSADLVGRQQSQGTSIWQTKEDFLNLLGNDLMQQMAMEVKEVFIRRLEGSSHVAVVDESLVARSMGAADNCVR